MKSGLLLIGIVVILAAITASTQTPISCGMTITTPGSYILLSDLTCPSTPAVQVGASDVDVNLNDHVLMGPGPGALGTGIILGADGPACVAVNNVAVHDGTVMNFGRT
jgi:hypothetical protein